MILKPGGGPSRQSQAWIKEEGLRQEGQPAVKTLPKPYDHGQNQQHSIAAAREFPRSDVHDFCLRHARSEQRLPGQERTRPRKQVQQKEKEWRVGTINIGTLTGKGRETEDLMDRI